MRNKIDYGIDLGTTNSAIARMENGIPIIKKSDTLKYIKNRQRGELLCQENC